MNERPERGDESGSEIWTSSSSWEAQCLEELDRELEPNLDERLPQEKQFASEKLWYSFQNCASAVTTLYKGVLNHQIRIYYIVVVKETKIELDLGLGSASE